ncbi:sigma-70 family RNA polymerase sigma factor [Actinotalea solisilvae]|uniref:sigma-70 family RNA polymerase sigma factor n=1 Tax=Actinotalea solisilvae TaxID=2072922 RepID=UPI0018F1AAB9|nr:sigma-70 family RNA polymerase sigma factor [Actinotalea solisilvae]
MTISSAWDLSSDAELITAVRSGDASAFGVLYERHVGAARAVARQYSNRAADAEDAVSDAFSRVFSAIQGGGGPDVAFRAYLFTVLRRVAMERVEAGRRAVATDDVETFEAAVGSAESTEEPALAGFERGVVSRAYSSLPERWQAVLWYTEVEELGPAEIAPILGLTANGVAALAYRAREGLRQAYLQQHLAAPEDEACTIINKKLGAYVRGGLAKRETLLVESHLEECGTCRALVLELGDVNHGMRLVVAPLVLGAVAAAVLHGVGFGGAAGAAGAAAVAAGSGVAGTAGSGAAGSGAAGAAGSGAAGSGAASGLTAVGSGVASTASTAATVGAASAAGAGTTAAAGVAASGLVAAGVGVASTAGAPSASAAALPAAPGLVAAPAAVPVAAGAGTAAAGTAAAATGGGVAALLAAVPVGALGVAAAGVVVAAAVGVAGVLGVFSSEDEPGEPQAIEAPSEPAPTADDEAAGGTDEDGPTVTPGTTDGATDDATTDGTGGAPADGTAGGTTSGAVASGAGDTPADPGTTNPPPAAGQGTDPTPGPAPEPQPEPVPPPSISVLALPEVTFTAGVPEIVEVEVANTGGDYAGAVRTELSFGPDVAWSLTEVPGEVGGGGNARTATADSAWVCGPADATTAQCVRDGLPAGATSVLAVSVVVVDDELDGAADLSVGIRTWAPDLGDPPAYTALPAHLASAPGALSLASPAAPAEIVAGAPATVTVPVGNPGRTSLSGVTATVGLPTQVSASVAPGSPWACAPSAAVVTALDCTLDRLPRGGTVPLTLDLAADTALRNVARTAAVTASVRAPGVASPPDVEASGIVVRSAPASYTLQLVGEAARPAAVDATLRLTNVGGTDGYPTVSVELPAGTTLAPTSTGWTCAADGSRTCTLDPRVPADAGAVLPTLHLVAPPGRVPSGTYPLPVTITEGGETRTFAHEVRVVQAQPDLRSASRLTAPEALVGDATGEVTVELVNIGGTDVTDTLTVTLPEGAAAVSTEGWTVRGSTLERPVTVLATGATTVVLPVRSVVVDGQVTGVVRAAVRDFSATASVLLASAPADVQVATGVTPTTLAVGATATATVDLHNTGGTTSEVTAVVTLPAGTSTTGAGWACTTSGARVCETTAALAPGARQQLTLPVRNDGSGTTTRTGALGVVVHREGQDDVTRTHTLTLQAPVTSATLAGSAQTFVQGQTGTVSWTVTNTGTVPLSGLRLDVLQDRPVQWVPGFEADSWLCAPGGPADADARCAHLGTLAPGRSTTVRVSMQSPAHTEGAAPLPVRARLTGGGAAETVAELGLIVVRR